MYNYMYDILLSYTYTLYNHIIYVIILPHIVHFTND